VGRPYEAPIARCRVFLTTAPSLAPGSSFLQVTVRQAATIAEDGIRTITVGIGADYEAAQLTALADGGGGEFHHATNPGEIVEIVLGELRAMRVIATRDLRLRLTVRGARRWPLLGGDARQQGDRGRARFDRASTVARSGPLTGSATALTGSRVRSSAVRAQWAALTGSPLLAERAPPDRAREARSPNQRQARVVI
jgi:hypothetical protein